MKKINKKLSLILVSAFMALPQLATANERQMPVLDEIQPNDDLATVLSNRSEELQDFFSRDRRGFTVVYGIGSLDTVDTSSGRYVESVQSAYKQALVDAYTNMSRAINPNGIALTTTDNVNLSRSTGNAIQDRILNECKDEAQKAHNLHLSKEEAERKRRESLIGSIAARIRGDKKEEQDPQTSAAKADFIYVCKKQGPTFDQFSQQTQTLADVISGGRILESVIHQNQLGIILVRAPEYTEMARALRLQNNPSRILNSAREEVRNRVKSELDTLESGDIPVGTRMMRLSNNEWAIYGFGAMQVTTANSGSFMGSVQQNSDLQQSISSAQAELSRFSSLSIGFTDQAEQIRSVRVTYRIDYNVTQDTSTFQMDETEAFGSIVNTIYSARSSLSLKGSRTVDTRLVQGDGIDYYLSVVAWSPSIMASQLNDRSIQDSTTGRSSGPASNAARQNQSGSNQGGSNSAPSRVIRLNQDW